MSQDYPLTGVWRLARLESRTGTGEQLFPYGEHPQGMLICTSDGYVSLTVMAEHRLMLKGDLETADLEELKSVAQYMSYAGQYVVQEDTAVLRADVSLVPNHVGRAHVRKFLLEDDTLTLSSSPTLYEGTYQSMDSTWIRIAPGD